MTLLACACKSYSLDVQAVLAGWQASADGLKGVGAYEIEGKNHMDVFLPGQLKTSDEAWTSLISGSLYKLSLQPAAGDEEKDSFDGKLWYGFSRHRSQLNGSIMANPQKTAEIVPLDHLFSKSDWRFYWRLPDTVERIAVGGTVAVIVIYKANDRYLTVKMIDSNPVLLMDPKRAKELLAPHQMTFTPIGRGFLPMSLERLDVQGANVTAIRIKVLKYGTINGNPYPSTILQEISSRSTSGGVEKVLLRVASTIVAKPVAATRNLDFAINFPDGTTVLDDRKVGSDRVKKQMPPKNWFADHFRVILVAALGSLSILLLAIKIRQSPRKE